MNSTLTAGIAVSMLAAAANAAILAPPDLDGSIDANFLVEGVTLNGGQYIFDDSFSVPPVTGFYAASSDFAAYSNSLSITFPTAPAASDDVRVVIWNRSATAAVFNGVDINANGLKFIGLPTDGVTTTFEFTQWTSSADSTPATEWNFAIGGYRIFPDPAIYFQAELIPAPGAAGLLAVAGFAATRRRRR